MLGRLLRSIRCRAEAGLRTLGRRLARWTRPATSPALVLGMAGDLLRSRSAVVPRTKERDAAGLVQRARQRRVARRPAPAQPPRRRRTRPSMGHAS